MGFHETKKKTVSYEDCVTIVSGELFGIVGARLTFSDKAITDKIFSFRNRYVHWLTLHMQKRANTKRQ